MSFFTYAQQIKPGLHTLYYLAKQSSMAHITVGEDPRAIGVDFNLNKIYVVNTGGNTVSVIDGTNNTNVKNIPVGEFPISIAVDRIQT
jgi:YVTN family beta-propeller protein